MIHKRWLYQPAAGHHDYIIYDEVTGRDVALVRDFDEDNARVMTAAPDMLEALKVALEFIETTINLGYSDPLDELIDATEARDRIRDALAKVEETT